MTTVHASGVSGAASTGRRVSWPGGRIGISLRTGLPNPQVHSMKFKCLVCHTELDSKGNLPFNEEIKCLSCGKEYVIDYDYSGGGDLSFWLVGKDRYEQQL